jgi:hypothetical protein
LADRTAVRPKRFQRLIKLRRGRDQAGVGFGVFIAKYAV